MTRLAARRVVFFSGVASILLGLTELVLGSVQPPGPGPLGPAPDAVAGLGAILVGGIALALAAPGRERPRRAWEVWGLLGAAILATACAVLLALDSFGVDIGPIARNVAVVGVTVIIRNGVLVMLIVPAVALTLRLLDSLLRFLGIDR